MSITKIRIEDKEAMKQTKFPSLEDLKSLWLSVSWLESITKFPDRVLESVQNSDEVIAAWDGTKLVGLTTTKTDSLNAIITYCLVHKDYQYNNIGSRMIEQIKQKYRNQRIYVLTYNAKDFYIHNGFKEMHGLKLDIQEE